MNGKAESDGRGMGKNRIEALTDGIFAVAMTLLVLDIKPPVHLRFETSEALIDHLSALEHSFVMYAISFVVLAMFWMGHHLQFHFVRHVDRQLLWINLVFLLVAVVVPFSTNLVGDHGHLQLPVVLYAVNLLVLTLLLFLQLRHLAASPHLIAPDLTREAVAHLYRQLLLFGVVPRGFDRGVVLQPAAGHVPLRAARRACLPARQDRPVDARGDRRQRARAVIVRHGAAAGRDGNPGHAGLPLAWLHRPVIMQDAVWRGVVEPDLLSVTH